MICIPVYGENNVEILKKVAIAGQLGDMVEIRLDGTDKIDLDTVFRACEKPVIATYRSRQEGGKGSENYGTRMGYLMDAIEAGANYVDVEYSLPSAYRDKVIEAKGSSRVIISTHRLNGTPSRDELQAILKLMASTRADIVKIVTRATSWEDNFRILELIPRGRDIGVKTIAFCMGPLGRISRILSYLMGGYLTFASLGEGEESAEGQIPVLKMKRILDTLAV